MTLAGVFIINQDVIEIQNDENIIFFYKNFVDIALKAGGGVEKTEIYDLVLEMAVPCLESYFPLIIFSNSHLMICVCQIQMSKILGVIYAIKQLTDQE